MAKKGKTNKVYKPEKIVGRITNGLKVRLYNWSPLEHNCETCGRQLGKNTMVVWLRAKYYCNWDCSEKAKDE